MCRLFSLLVVGALAPAVLWAEPATPQDAARPHTTAEVEPRIDLAILLDTSGSMDGLINQARTQIWKVVNDLATAEKKGTTPHLRVALYEYGNDGLPADGGYLRQILPLTDDLDKVSEKLFALSTNGGSEYCGQVIQAATQGLDWSKRDDDLKIIVIAGNEPFTQGPVDYKTACPAAISNGVMINTIFCGNEQEGISTGWADGAKLADGTYAFIDQNRAVAEIETPFDAELARLGGAVNGTYLFFGDAATRGTLANNQVAQDANAAAAAPAAAANRALTKSGKAYNNASRDVVDAVDQDKDALGRITEEQLPAELKGKTAEEQKKIVAERSAERKKIQQQIQELGEKRDAYIAAERKKQATAEGAASLDEALIHSLRGQAKQKNYSFRK